MCRRERHDIPLIVQTCVDEVEKRGLTEVGVYRVAGVMRDVQELRQSFDTGGGLRGWVGGKVRRD